MSTTLRAEKLAELKEFDRIIKKATDERADLFAAPEVLGHFRKETQPCPIPLHDDFEINFYCNYYKDFAAGLSDRSPLSIIETAWQKRWRKLSPVADIGGLTWRKYAQDPVAQYNQMKDFEKLCTAYNILSNPVLREKYENGGILGPWAAEKVAKRLEKEVDRAEQIMRKLSDLKAQIDQGAEQEKNRHFQIGSSEGENKYTYVKDLNANRYVKVLRKAP